MTGGRCTRRKKMMGRGPDGGCGTEERPCRLISRVLATQQVSPTTKKKPSSCDVDFFSQARKVLSERSPFDVPEDGSGSNISVGSSSFSTLPCGLASLLKHSDTRKRHKKSHSRADKKSSRASERSKGGNIWVETEEYFRDLALLDIDALFDISSSIRSLAASKCFLIPYIGNEKHVPVVDTEKLDKNVIVNCGNGSAHANEVVDNNVTVNYANESSHLNEVLVKDEVKQEDEQFMEIDSVGAQSDRVECLSQEEGKACSISDISSGLEWLLSCRSRIMLTSERPSKKRKLLGTDAGLEKILIASPCEGNLSSCDFCCKGEMGNESNRLIVCSSCKVSVHLNCYGIQGDVDESWLCSWCKHKTVDEDSVKQPCVLCPKQCGALKPVGVESSGSIVEFAHLFCSLWMPEVYVEDLLKMEPIMNVQEIKETRRKLVCNVCKVKCGACVRCSHGTCRTAFHPICAREARQRMEVWGKYGSENVELRAFCSKHSEFHDGRGNPQLGDPIIAMRSDSSTANCVPSKLLTDKQHKLKIGHNVEAPDSISDKSADSESQEIELSDSRLNDVVISECADGDQIFNMGMSERSDNEDAKLSDSLNLARILKKLIDRGKVNTKDVALEIGISPDSLLSTLAEDNLVPDLQCKIVKWLRNHAHMGTLHKSLKVKLKSTILPMAEIASADCSDGVTVLESDITDPVAVKSVPPRRRTKSNIRILRDNKIICSSEEFSSDSVMLMDEVKVDQLANGEPANLSEVSIPVEKKSINLDGFQKSLAAHFSKPGGCTPFAKVESEHATVPQEGDSSKADHANPVRSDMNTVLPDLIKNEEFSHAYVHPYIHKKLLQMQNVQLVEDDVCGMEGLRVGETCSLEASCNASVCCDHQNIHSMCNDLYKSVEVNPDQLVKDEKVGVFELSPADEVEGEIIYFQHRLLDNAVARKCYTDNLICKVAKSMPQEIDIARAQRWDAVLVNQYLVELREAKKQGRKERKHKEAQAVLAAATAAAASSSRVSSFRKDTYDDPNHQEKFDVSNGRAGLSSQLMPRPKETLSRVAVPRNSSEKYSDFVQSVPDFSKEHPRSCDICRRSETILNPILVCSSCKVAVHLDCYRSVKESTGPWYCELCEELLSSKCSAAASLNFWEKPYFVAECSLCGGTTGAFRKSTDGQWVHAFCAEWVFEPTFRRGQVNPVEGMETVAKGIDICCICRRKHGVCIKCSYGHCQATFHPSCARSTGFYMNVKSLNGKLHHKAYCERHGLEQRAKAESQKHGVEELKSMKQIRVELERLRLLCERIIKREKIKRDLVLCSHSILACKRDNVARSVLVHSSFFPPDVSSESATTSLKGNADGYKSCSDAIQRSDDVTVDSTISTKYQIKVVMDADQKTDDSSTSQSHFTRKPMERMSFAGKQIPHGASLASCNPLEEGEWSSKSRKRFETFEKELVMTSDQASMKNQQLPKGYFYIPVDCLPKEKQINQGGNSGGPLEQHR